MSSSCLDDATILAVGRGTVQGAERLPIEEHVAECDECRSLVSAVARGSMLDLVAVLGDSVSPKPPSVSIPTADAAALSERVAREVRQSGIGHAAPPVAPRAEDTEPKLASEAPAAMPVAEAAEGAEDELVTTIPEPLAKANPLAASAPPVAAAPVVSRTPEILPTPPPPPVVVPDAPLSENPFAPNRKPLWIGLALVVLAAVSAVAALR